MNRKINLYEAKTNLSSLVDDAASGESIVICKNGKPRAKLTSLEATDPEQYATGKRKLGFLEGQMQLKSGWDAPMSIDDLLPELDETTEKA